MKIVAPIDHYLKMEHFDPPASLTDQKARIGLSRVYAVNCLRRHSL